MDERTFIEHVQRVADPHAQAWVLFEYGTYILVDQPGTAFDAVEEATRIMKELGPVHADTSSGDFLVTTGDKAVGSIISYNAEGIYTCVDPDELGDVAPDEMMIGLYGRSRRVLDSGSLRIIHRHQAAG